MMEYKKFMIAMSFFSVCVSTWAKEVTDTLDSSKGDRVIISYDISQNNGQITIKFHDAKKKLGRTYRDKYKKLDQVAVLFFDKKGNYEENMVFSGIDIDAFMIPKEVKYKKSNDGYFLVGNTPPLSIELKYGESAELSIPIFLAHYEGKLHYKVFSRCEDLKIKLSKMKSAKTTDETITQTVSQTITTQEELEGEFTIADEVNILVKKVNDLLAEQNEYPFTDELKQAISRLRDRSYHKSISSDSKLSAQISEVLTACKLKEDKMKDAADAAVKAAAQDAEQQARLAEKEAQARQDSIDAEAAKVAEEERKQNLWMIIGGILLAVFLFIGNQTFQHFRNVKNQQSMIEMQQKVVKRAEDEAKRRARSMAQSQVNRVQNEARRKTRTVINDKIGKIGEKGKDKKGISI